MFDKLAALQGLWHEKAPYILPAVQIHVPPNLLQLKKRVPSVKVPSDIGANDKAYCLREWTQRNSTPADILRYAEDSRLGFGVRCAYIRAIDIDVEDVELAKLIYEIADRTSRELQRGQKLSSRAFAIRRRTGSTRYALLCKATHFESLPFAKVVIKLPGDFGKIEFLGNSQYIALYGKRYDDEGNETSEYFFQRYGTDFDPGVEEAGKYPVLDQLPTLSNDDLLFIAGKLQEELEHHLSEVVGITEDFSTSTFQRGFSAEAITELGEIQLKVLDEKNEIYHAGTIQDARWYVKCPWEHQHTSANGERDAMFIPDRIKDGVNFGATFKCFHAHCENRSIEDYAEELDIPVIKKKEVNVQAAVLNVKAEELENCVTVDMLMSMFSFLSHSHALEIIKVFASPEKSNYAVVKMLDNAVRPYAHRRQTMNEVAARQNTGKKAITATSKKRMSTTAMVNAIRDCNNFGFDLSYDTFLNNVKIRKFDDHSDWQPFMDKHIAVIKIAMNRLKFPDPSTGHLREAITLVSETNTSDCAIDWLDCQEWDGISRYEEFITKGLGLESSDYLIALTDFIWTALAGRIISPGVKVDMIPIFVGFQGAKKSSFVKALAPFEEWYGTTALDVHDSDIARKTIGKCILELPELSGLKTRALESIKAWVTTQVDQWVPKYKESAYSCPRRWVAFGTGNDMRLFTDSTGNRRWLPIDMAPSLGLNVDWLIENRNQLWAEGKVKFRQDGVAHEEVARLAGVKREAFKPRDLWAVPIQQFYYDYGRLPTVNEAFTICLNMQVSYVTPYQVSRVESVLAILEAELAGRDSEGIVQRSYVQMSPAISADPIVLQAKDEWEF